MSKYFIGSAAAAAIIGIVARLFFQIAKIELPFSLDWIDFFIVISTAGCLGVSAYCFILKKYPDTREMLPLFSVIVWAVIVSSYLVLRYQDTYQTSLSILVTGVFVGMGWWIQSITSAAHARRTHTLNIIMSSRTSSEYQMQSRNMNKSFRASAMAPELAEWRVDPNKDEFRDTEIPPELKDALDGSVYVLNYYEFLAQGIKFRDLDDCLLRECFSSILGGLERRNFHLIIEAQKGDQKAFEGVTRLAQEWCGESIVEKYRANPANAPIGPLYPPKEEVQRIMTAKKKPSAGVTPIHQGSKPTDESAAQQPGNGSD
ncbi:DUF4760 domain-containing protein [Pseudomonas monteilii]|uniref:DUF4760 domain-containing protein n=1 Tax=Pseudomonas monteilii TaxID=76759 RepID=UPI0037F130AD